MNTYTATWGALLAASGAAMHYLLLGLGQESFFMAGVYLPPAQVASYGIIAAGIALLLGSFLTEWPGIYIVIAYAFFVMFGVVGMLAWSMMYRFTPAFFSREFLDRRSVL